MKRQGPQHPDWPPVTRKRSKIWQPTGTVVCSAFRNRKPLTGSPNLENQMHAECANPLCAASQSVGIFTHFFEKLSIKKILFFSKLPILFTVLTRIASTNHSPIHSAGWMIIHRTSSLNQPPTTNAQKTPRHWSANCLTMGLPEPRLKTLMTW